MAKRTKAASAASEAASSGARVVYIHGVGQRERAAPLKTAWDQALFRGGMGLQTRMAYWADVTNPDLGTTRTRTLRLSRRAPKTLEALTEPVIASLPEEVRGEAEAYVNGLARRLAAEDAGASEARTRILPGPLRRPFTAFLTRLFLRDTAAYFFDEGLREAMRERLRTVLTSLRERSPLVLVAHSQGTIIAYDVLHELGESFDEPLTLVTLGSPLGLAEVQDHVRRPLEVPPGVAGWLNFADPLDPVALDNPLAAEFAPEDTIEDDRVRNAGRPRNPHSATGYLVTAEVRRAVRTALGVRFNGVLPRDVVGRDVAVAMDEGDEPVAVLIELRDDGTAEDGKPGGAPEPIAARAKRLEAELRKIVEDPKAAEIDRLRHYVAARLWPEELDELTVRSRSLAIQRVWRNTTKRALLDESSRTIHADAAQNAYGASGEGIGWAVLDTGIERRHPHFRAHRTIAAAWDCTRTGPPRPRGFRDRDGHGTHVAGIIAGDFKEGGTRYAGIAPEASVHAYKVLRDDGSGEDSYIIKALDHIAELNESHSRMVIHGVNLSLGGPFDPWVYACGHSPICRELRRLWRQGVLVCVAAGNEGQLWVEGEEEAVSVNLDLSIGDPANLEECIAVGSVHKTRPHSFGISHFSSKGPTADGRAKPDVVAPGERILSADAAFKRTGVHYVEQSGTSMACPHVSGLLAAFLSVRREFIGQPDEVKARLLRSCTDLGRDRYVQGAGLPNLHRMLAET